MTPLFRLVQLANGAYSLRSLIHQETFHPVIGPAAEAQSLYVHQLRLRERAAACAGEFVVWDVGLGAAANAIAVLRATQHLACPLRLVSFDCSDAPLHFALENFQKLGYLDDFLETVQTLAQKHTVQFERVSQRVHWDFVLADFPAWLGQLAGRHGQSTVSNPPSHAPGLAPGHLPPPHAILFDAYSPAKNPAMWTLLLFTRLYQMLSPDRPAAMATYSRSTLLRVTLLLAGFYVGHGYATGEKEETTIASNHLCLIDHPLDQRWLRRARNSTSAEPLREPVYCQAPLTDGSWIALQKHPQFV